MDYFDTPVPVEVLLYRKYSGSWIEVGSLVNAEMTPDDAYDVFAEVLSASPPTLAVIDAAANRVSTYEARLVVDKKVVSLVSWPPEVMQVCVDDHLSAPRKTYFVTAYVEVPEDASADPTEWDWLDLASTGRIDPVDAEERA